MKLRAVAITLLLVVSLSAPVMATGSAETAQECSFPVTQTDATGTEVTVDERPERVVVLAPSAAQTMWEIDAKEQVVGMPVNQYTSYLTGYDMRENIMNPDGFTVNTEKVVNLTPDLVLAPNIIPDPTVAKLREAGLTVYNFQFAANLDDVSEKTLLTGRLTGNCEAADERVARMEARLETIREAVADEPKPTVIYPLGGGFVPGEGTFLHEIIVTAGGRNVAAEANITGYAKISMETIVVQNPDWLILNKGLPTSAIQMHAYNHTTAVKKGQIVRINPNYANQPAPRVVIAIETIAKALHPEAFEESQTSPTPTPAEETQGEDTAAEASPTATPTPVRTPTESPGQPGFGLLAALVAILGTLFARHVRAKA